MSLPAASPSPYRRMLSKLVPSRRARKLAVVVLVVLSLASLALSPLHETVERVKEVVPWAGGALALSEMLFVVGLAIIAWPAGAHLGWNPLRWHHRLGSLLRAGLAPTATFWIGLAVNTVGAVGSAVAVLVAVVVGLPPSAWGLLVLPLADLLVTIGVRSAVVAGSQGKSKEVERW